MSVSLTPVSSVPSMFPLSGIMLKPTPGLALQHRPPTASQIVASTQTCGVSLEAPKTLDVSSSRKDKGHETSNSDVMMIRSVGQ